MLNSITVEPKSAFVGAEVFGLDATRKLSQSARDAVIDVWHNYGVLVLRDQSFTKESLVRFSECFGTPVQALHQESALSSSPQHSEIMIVSNVMEEGKPIGHLGNKEAAWHTDMCYTDNPPIASILYAVEVPQEGGETGFMNMYDVYDRLPPVLKSRIASLQIKHDRCYTAVGDLRHGFEPVGDVANSPGSIHPMVKSHPITRRKALYLGRRLNSYVVSLSVGESEALLDELWEYTAAPAITWHHHWRVGDILVWDNRCLMHRRSAFNQDDRRIMWRTQILQDPHNPN